MDMQVGEVLVLHGERRCNLDSGSVHRRPSDRRDVTACQARHLHRATSARRLPRHRTGRRHQEPPRVLDARGGSEGRSGESVRSSGAVPVLRAARAPVSGVRARQRGAIQRHHHLELSHRVLTA